jgi:hypothetical protein
MALTPTSKKNAGRMTDTARSHRDTSTRRWYKSHNLGWGLLSILALLIASAAILVGNSHAAGVDSVSSATGELAVQPKPASPAKTSKVDDSKIDWDDLTAAQRQTLAPLASGWDKLKPSAKKKWIEISKRYASMTPTEQARVQERMHDWVNLTPEQRRLVRENYARNRRLDTEQRAKRWLQYQQLPEEEKKKLAAEAAAAAGNRKHVTTQVPATPAKNKPAKQIQLTPQPVPPH